MGSILLVESDPETSERWSRALEEVGHEVVGAAGMRDALNVIREGGIDVVIVDAYPHQVSRDPRSGIIELARGIEALPDAPPIILVSASPNAPEVSARIGAATFLPKPCEADEVLAAVTDVLGRLRPVRMVHESEPIPPLDHDGGVIEIDDEPTGQMNFG